MTTNKQINKQKGFTLIEIAIVMVIIGLLLGGVLKGQELINNAKIKSLYAMKDQMAAAYLTYYDRYNAYPGDDGNADTNVGATTAGNGSGNGLVTAAASGDTADLDFGCTASATGESCNAYEHLRLANLISGTGRLNPKNPYGGTVSVSHNTHHGLTNHWIQFENVPGEAGQIIDRKYDDGVDTTGSIRASGAYSGALIDLYMVM